MMMHTHYVQRKCVLRTSKDSQSISLCSLQKKKSQRISLQTNHCFIFFLNFGMKKIVWGEKQYFTGWNRCRQSAFGVEKAAVFYNGRNSMWHVENELLSQPEISLVLMAWDIQWRVLSSSSFPFSIFLPVSFHPSICLSLCITQRTCVMNELINCPWLVNKSKKQNTQFEYKVLRGFTALTYCMKSCQCWAWKQNIIVV